MTRDHPTHVLPKETRDVEAIGFGLHQSETDYQLQEMERHIRGP